MKIALIEIFQYTLPLIKPLLIKGTLLTTRQGFIIRLQNEHHHKAYGEVSPFPSLHSEDCDEAKLQLIRLQKELSGQILPDCTERLKGTRSSWLGQYHLSPSVHFGIETAILNLIAHSKHQSLARMLSKHHPKTILVNALITSGDSHIEQECKRLVHEGYKAIKLKVGRRKVEEELDTLKRMRNSIDENIALRLDANRAWPLETAIIFGKAAAEFRIEYIEEPLVDYSQSAQFFKETNLPIAFDETLRDLCTEHNLNSHNLHSNTLEHLNPKIFEGVKAFILKPAVLGSYEKTFAFANFAKHHSIIPVISSSFCSGVGLTAEADIAASLNESNIPVGLDTYKWLKDDLLSPRFQTVHGQIDLEMIHKTSTKIRMELLKKI
ncbi:MAG: o-succinylbenzoate synthase [bacterium]